LKSKIAAMRLLILFCILPTAMFSQIFMQGNLIEAGVHTCGSFGSDTAPPPGFHPTQTCLGLVFDHYYDGWDSGTPPFMGDFFVPGSPEEGWGIEFNVGATSYNFNNFGLNGYFDVGMISLTDLSTPELQKCEWNGKAISGTYSAAVNQIVSFGPNDYFIKIDVEIINTCDFLLQSFEYIRNIDPDNEVDWTDDYTTKNYVLKQPGSVGNPDTAMICARGLIYDIPIYLIALDSRVRCSAEGFSNRDPDDIYDSPLEYSITSPSIMDEAIAIAFRFGDLEPDDTISFSYLYAFDDKVLMNDGIFDYLTQSKEQKMSTGFLNVFPNPAGDNIKLNFRTEQCVSAGIEIIDVFGKTVYRESEQKFAPGSHEMEINTSALKGGVYFVKMEGNNISLSKKIVKLP